MAMLAAGASAASLATGETALEFNPGETQVEFTLGAMLHTVHGTFALKRGYFRFDGAGKAEGELVVDALSGNSGNNSRDSRMHKSILESQKFGEIVFRPDHIEGQVAPQGNSSVQLRGTFTIHGAEHPLTVPVEVEAANGQFKATAHFAIPYVQWGMKNPSTLLLRVSEQADITVHAVGRVTR
jgi:polyisoprenoid-binding protein YceI